jgi:type IV secretion system protein VirB9
MTITTSNDTAHDKALKDSLSKLQKQPMPNVLVNPNNVIQMNNESGVAPKTKKRRHIKHKRKEFTQTLPSTLASMRFDFTYHGDVNNLIDNLKDYDPNLKALSPRGRINQLDFNADLANTNIDEIASSLNNQTDGKVNLVYDPNNNTARLLFSNKITSSDFATDVVEESKKIRSGTKLKLVEGDDGVIKMPFGGPYPVICKPLRMCDIRLEAGEMVRGWTLSDKENWILPGASSPQFLYSGEDGNTTPHIILKPAEAGLDSNLIITTNKRTYNISLQSSKDNYVTAVAFYYPGEINQGLADQRNQQRMQAQNQGSIPLGKDSSSIATFNEDEQAMIPVGNLNFNYEVSGDNVDWKPVQVFDDGTHVWLKFAQNRQIYPPLFEIDADGANKALLIYQPMPGGYYRVDSLFNKAALIVGGGTDYEKKVVIALVGANKPWYKRIFGG